MYGNRFVGTPLPVDPLMSRSNSARSISPNPSVKRERRVSSYGDGGWSSQFQHQRSYSTADKLVPMHTGTTSSDEVSSMSSSFPATPRDTGGTFLRMSESFKEDPEDYDESASSVLGDNSSPTRGLSSANPEVFRQAYDKFSQISLSGNSPISTRKSLSSLASPTTPEPESSLPDIVVNENTGNSGSSTTTASPETIRSLPKTVTEPPSPSTRTEPPVTKESGRKAKTGSIDGGFGYAIVHSRSSARSPSPSSSTTEVKAPKIITTPDDLPSPPMPPSTLLKVKQSQQSLRQLSLKPPGRPISIGLSTPEIMDRFPPVPSSPSANQQSAAKIARSKSNLTNSTNAATGSTTSSTTASAPTSAIATNSTAPPPPQPAKKPTPKSSIPGWWDYNSDDEDVGGWATVVVATKSSY
jgi:hypothetical protein